MAKNVGRPSRLDGPTTPATRFGLVLAAIALVAVACTSSTTPTTTPDSAPAAEREVRETTWRLRSLAGSDLRELIIVVNIETSCSRFGGSVVDESDQSVTIVAQVNTRTDIGCDDVESSRTRRHVLRQPLGERDLLGCGFDDCRMGLGLN